MIRDDIYKDMTIKTILRKMVSKTRSGGRIKSMSVLVVMGNGKGKFGIGSGKAQDYAEAQKKAEKAALKNLVSVPLINGTIPHNVLAKSCATTVHINRAKQGTGLIAGGVARDLFEVVGVHDIVCKIIGNSSSAYNVIYAMQKALSKLRTVEEIAQKLGKTTQEIRERYYYKAKKA